MMEPLDGNAIAGKLNSLFGDEMTMAKGICASCHTMSRFAELRVYTKAPGAVARCPFCGHVVMVLVEVRGTLRCNLDGLAMLEGSS
jgi:hypothetical protein